MHGHLQPADPSVLQRLPSVLLLLLFSFCTVLPSGEVVVVAANTGSNHVGEANLQPLYAELWCGGKSALLLTFCLLTLSFMHVFWPEGIGTT